MYKFIVLCVGHHDYESGASLRYDCVAETPEIALAVAKHHWLSLPWAQKHDEYTDFYVLDTPPVLFAKE